MSGPGPAPEGDRAITDVVRWAAFSCLLVPVVLLWCGSSLAGATGIALGLAAVTGACHVLMRRSAHAAAHPPSEDRTPHRGRHHHLRTRAHRTGGGAHRSGRHDGGDTPVG
ncbi:hypothetical protein [Streptomyces sp. NPDC052012]|uniref:hypothetical protein n=1 Tax=Streptomyces sp. NPDC052012 TaxID=3155051 RepID=UPI00344FEF1A